MVFIMADKKLITYDVTLSFSFKTKDNDFMNPNFTFGHACICLDSIFGGLITLSGSSKSKNPIIVCDLENVLFSCFSDKFVDLTSEDLFKSVLAHRNFEDISGCVFQYQPVKGPRFLLGVNERVSENGLQKENEKKLVSEEFPKRSRCKKS